MADTWITAGDVVSTTVCQDFAKASRLEWLATNHTGAFAMGTVCGTNTRRYHGLLIATLNAPSDRYAILSRLEETIAHENQTLSLAAVQYPGVVTPEGYRYLQSFSPLPIPTWIYQHGALTITKTVRLLDGQQSVIVSYTASHACEMHVRVFIAGRDYHSLMRENPALDRTVRETPHSKPGRLEIQPYSNLPPFTFLHNAERFEESSAWYRNHEYLREFERGMDFREDLYSPGILHFKLHPGKPGFLMASIEKDPLVPGTGNSKPRIQPALAMDHFRVLRSDGQPSLIAGYPWFTDWSRDTLISLPALMACGFEGAETKAILTFLLAQRQQGILPNRFSDRNSTPEYNTVDASLWFFVAAHAYLRETEDFTFLKSTLYAAAVDMIDWHRRGTFYGIQVDPADHLLAAGETGTQLTWMDAKVGDYVVTPRIGKAVEINALWYNVLRISSDWAEKIGQADHAAGLAREAELVKVSFQQKFWNAERGCLFDVIGVNGPDASLRPNQLLALSLPHPLLDAERGRQIIKIVELELLTPYGLRTLESRDPRYRGRYDGDMHSRDTAYHQGTVWPWLIGPFIDAYLFAYQNGTEAIAHCATLIDSMLRLTNDCCLGFVAEVYDGDQPHRPGGCPAQLWSVAQVALAQKRVHDLGTRSAT